MCWTLVTDFSPISIVIGDVGNDLHATIWQHDIVASLNGPIDLLLTVGEVIAGRLVFDSVRKCVVLLVQVRGGCIGVCIVVIVVWFVQSVA